MRAAAAFPFREGANAVQGKGDDIASVKQLLAAAVDHHEAEIAATKAQPHLIRNCAKPERAFAQTRKEMTV